MVRVADLSPTMMGALRTSCGQGCDDTPPFSLVGAVVCRTVWTRNRWKEGPHTGVFTYLHTWSSVHVLLGTITIKILVLDVY